MVHFKQEGIRIQLGSPDRPLLVTGAAFADNSMLFLSSHAQAQAFFQPGVTFDFAFESKLNPESATHVIQHAGSTQVQPGRPTPRPRCTGIHPRRRSSILAAHYPSPGGFVQHCKIKLEGLSQFVSTMNSSQMHMFGHAQFITHSFFPECSSSAT